MKLQCTYCGTQIEYPFHYKTGEGLSYKEVYDEAIREISNHICGCVKEEEYDDI